MAIVENFEINALVVQIRNQASKDNDLHNMKSDELFKRMSGKCEADLAALIEALENLGKKKICRVLPSASDERRADVWQDFYLQILPCLIRDYEESKNINFTAYIVKALTNFACSAARKIIKELNIIKNSVSTNENEENALSISPVDKELYDTGRLPDLEKPIVEKHYAMEIYTRLISCLDRLRRPIAQNKLVFHCKYLLEDDDYSFLRDLQGNSLKDVAASIENAYTVRFEQKTYFLQNLMGVILKEEISENTFLEGVELDTDKGKQKIRGIVSAIRTSLSIETLLKDMQI